MKFDYKKVAPTVLRPIIPIQIGSKDRFINYEVLVDSGADLCLFDAEIGELVGVNIKDGEKLEVRGITGQAEYYYLHPIVIKVGGWDYKTKVGFMPNLNNRYSYGVVGQKGFFDIFIVKFDLLKEQIELKNRS